MSVRITTISFLVIFISAISQPLFADGCFVTDNYGSDVYAPDQKVVISWDGKTETMILSTKLQSDELSNFGWIIPIKSTRKPEVELGDIQIFYEISKYFNPPIPPSIKGPMSLSAGDSFNRVEIIETKKLDIFDITILRATDSEQLYKWLKINNFKVNENSKEILRFYATKEFFFITAKINLQNKYEDDIAYINRPLYGKDIKTLNEKVNEVLAIYYERSRLSRKVTRDILLGKPYSESNISKSAVNEIKQLLTIEEYEELRNKYSEGDNPEKINPELEKYLSNKFQINQSILNIEPFTRVQSILYKLKSGIHHPLKISFKTNQALFPLKISSMNKGNVAITGYIFAKDVLKDKNNILRITEWKEVTKDFKSQVSKYLPVRASKYVTKLTFSGKSSDFVNDVYFGKIDEKEKERNSEKGIAQAKHERQAILSNKELMARAVSNGDIDTVKVLMKKGVDIHGDYYGKSLLHVAVERPNNTIEMIIFLLDKGIDINSKDKEGNTPLKYAINGTEMSHLKSAVLLIERGGVASGNKKLGWKIIRGIISKPNGRSLALLGTKILYEGDEIDGWKVKEILKNSVILENAEGKKMELNMNDR